MKTCARCLAALLQSAFARDGSRADGLRRQCRECDNARRRSWTAANPDKAREQAKRGHASRAAERAAKRAERHAALQTGGKRCPACLEVKPLEAFSSDPTKASGRASWCRACRPGGWPPGYYERNAGRLKAAERLETAELSDTYVRRKLVRDTGIPIQTVPQALVNLKREHLRMLRALKDQDEDR